MVKCKKSIAMLLAIALMISCLPLSAFAADAEPASTNACQHLHFEVWHSNPRYRASGDKCIRTSDIIRKCLDCGYTEPGTSTEEFDHSPSVYHATCNGRVQTHYQRCANCSYSLGATTVACPNAPHTGSCIALPASVDIPAEKY